MAGSQSVATATALRALGREVDQTVVIAGVPDGSPSAGVLEVDDVLVSVDGDAATSADAVRPRCSDRSRATPSRWSCAATVRSAP